MTSDPPLDPTTTAVVSLDLQTGVVGAYVQDVSFTRRAAAVMGHARGVGIPVIHVKVAFRRGVPEASPRNGFLSAVKHSVPHQRFFEGASGAIHPDLAPADDDLVVSKNRVGAFVGTDLDLLLRAHDRQTLIVFGIATSGAVLSTVLHAIDLDYRVVVISDCCADRDEPLHALLMQNLFPRQTHVLTAEEVTRRLTMS